MLQTPFRVCGGCSRRSIWLELNRRPGIFPQASAAIRPLSQPMGDTMGRKAAAPPAKERAAAFCIRACSKSPGAAPERRFFRTDGVKNARNPQRIPPLFSLLCKKIPFRPRRDYTSASTEGAGAVRRMRSWLGRQAAVSPGRLSRPLRTQI